MMKAGIVRRDGKRNLFVESDIQFPRDTLCLVVKLRV
jgi:hypothetical protein